MFIFQNATADNADEIASIVIEHSDGVVEKLFKGLIPGLSAASILSAAFIKGEEPYQPENVFCSIADGVIISMLFCYPAASHKIPALLESFIPNKRLQPVRPILERSLPDSLYVNTMWIAPSHRTECARKSLLRMAENICSEKGLDSLSLFCWHDHVEDMRFLQEQGFLIAEQLEQNVIPLENHPGGGAIMYKPLASA